MNKIFEYAKKPALYAKSTCAFWDDDHISKGMLEAHLHPEWDAGTRAISFVDQSVLWISEIAPPTEYKNALDLGCGPGLYAERFYEKGYTITGIDFSRRSIAYAKEQAEAKKQDITYICESYLDIKYQNAFDLMMMIYCDYGALSSSQRQIMLKKVYDGLREGGKFIFDVFTPKQYEGKEESSSWYLNEGAGFWRPNTHLCLESHYIYEDHTRVDQYVLVDQKNNLDVIRTWDHYYTKESIVKEIMKAGFKNIEIYADVAGTPYHQESKTMCIVVEK